MATKNKPQDDRSADEGKGLPLEVNDHDHLENTVDHDHATNTAEAERDLTVDAMVEAEAEGKTLPDPYAQQGFIGVHPTDNHITTHPSEGPGALTGETA